MVYEVSRHCDGLSIRYSSGIHEHPVTRRRTTMTYRNASSMIGNASSIFLVKRLIPLCTRQSASSQTYNVPRLHALHNSIHLVSPLRPLALLLIKHDVELDLKLVSLKSTSQLEKTAPCCTVHCLLDLPGQPTPPPPSP